VVFKTRQGNNARPRSLRRTRVLAALGATAVLVGVGATAPVHAAPAPSGSAATSSAGGWTGPGGGDPSLRAAPPAAPYGEFTAVTPSRLLDTRDGTGQPGPGPLGQFQTKTLQVSGRGGVPSTGVAAVVLNVTVDAPSFNSYVTVWPSGTARPLTSNLNFVPGQTVPNLVTVGLGAGGQVDLFNSLGRTDVIADVMGYYSDASGAAGARYHPLTPSRVVDSRTGQGVAVAGPRSAGTVTKVNFGAGQGILATTATAVVLNVTVTGPNGGGFFTLYPDDAVRPVSSNVNFVPGTTRANQVIVKVPANGLVDVYMGGIGVADVVIDISGYYDNVKTTDAGRFIPLSPYRAFDTRSYGDLGKLQEASGVPLKPTGDGTIPATGVSAVLINLTATEPSWSGYLSVYPADVTSLPTVSAVNFNQGETAPNHVIASLSTAAAGNPPNPAGTFYVYNGIGQTHVVVDAYGYFTG